MFKHRASDEIWYLQREIKWLNMRVEWYKAKSETLEKRLKDARGLSESSLKKDWDTPEEDEAWKDLGVNNDQS